ncbi:Gfo/Idh/MocA family protein [Paenibacillus agricola]|uniref:Gfo/Idh/MocA family oxidoreductase n=1 Tax=Paenibacillus agricola TaxID=2716264 RepID=A0ABX0JFJ1_9BACL|nr:Gfo/Idh/MocA family oxidoreductase [Paenibacillus agricola]NHN32460.1 Gfo/Idh/MocA family oxidoreductase [Paenibacillus agricola]
MRMGVIGYGNRIGGMIKQIQKADPECQVSGIVDPNKARSKVIGENQGGKDIPCFDTPDEMLQSLQLDGVLIGTRCSLHTKMALQVLPSNIPLYLEKPVATTMEDLMRLKHAHELHHSRTIVSFPLRVTTLVQLVKEIIGSGKIGSVEHVQAVNNVPYGGVYFHSWYRDENETGGLFLQKATHDFDYINDIIGQRPVSVCAMVSKQIFKGSYPAGLKCVDCAENRTCAESTAFTPERELWPHCCFAEDTGNEDSGSALMRYESGMHMSYSQNFFARRQAATRGARFLGYKGTVEFDFVTGKVQVFMHHTPRVETYQLELGEDHFGGDRTLAESFIGMMRGTSEPVATLEDGLLSALQCLKARESAITETFQTIAWG